MARTLRSTCGQWVVGEDFWGREAELRETLLRIRSGHSLQITAQRRMGKTSLMRETIRRLGNDYYSIFLDFEHARDIPEAISLLAAETRSFAPVWDKVKTVFSNLGGALEHIDSIQILEVIAKFRAGMSKADWKPKASAIIAALEQADRPVLIVMDELPILINRVLKDEHHHILPEGAAAVDDFMSWLRAAAQRPEKKVQLVVGGSIGLEPVLRQAGLIGTINHLSTIELPPWTREEALGCLEALAHTAQVELEAGVDEHMLARLGLNIPHHVQLYMDKVLVRARRAQTAVVSLELVNDVYEQDMLSTRGHPELAHYEDRLQKVLGPEKFALANDLLSEAAISGRLIREALDALWEEHRAGQQLEDGALKEVLWVLEHDGYLKLKGKSYVFDSSLVRDWWKDRNTLLYTPVRKRR